MARYFLDMDGDGHWYIVPLDKKEEWEEWLHYVYVEDYDEDPYGEFDHEEDEIPEGVIEIGGSPNSFTFENPEFY